MISQEQLENFIKNLKNSDRTAFNNIYMLFYPLLSYYSRLMVPEDLAKDVVQDVFIKLWINRHSLKTDTPEDIKSFRAYLLRMTYNTTISAIRKQLSSINYLLWAKDELESLYASYDIDKSDIMRKLYCSDISRQIAIAIDSLPDKCREVFKLSHIEGLSDKEIANRMNLSISTVENHIHNALVRLRKFLSEEIL